MHGPARRLPPRRRRDERPARVARPADRRAPAGAIQRSPPSPAPSATAASTGRTSTAPGPRSSATMRGLAAELAGAAPPTSATSPARRLPAAAAADPGRGRPARPRRRRRARCSRCSPVATTRSASSAASTAARRRAAHVVRHRDRTVHVFAARARPGAARRGAGAVGAAAGDVDRARHGRRRPLPAARHRPRRPSSAVAVLAAALAAADAARRGAAGGAVVSHADGGTACSRSGGPTTTVCGPTGWRPDAAEPTGDPARFEEDVKFRGLHPMIARRLQMWRLENFDITPPPGGRRRPRLRLRRPGEPDRRAAIAVAEVRDLTPVRDEDGRAVALPEVESVLVACLDAIRRRASSRPAATAWSGTGSCSTSGRRSTSRSTRSSDRPAPAPLTDGLGLEQVVVSGRLPARRRRAGGDGDAPRLRGRLAG